MARLGTLIASSCAAAAAMGIALPAAAAPGDEPDVDASPRSVAAGQTFSVTVSGCAGGHSLQVQIDPAGIVASASCEGEPGFASAQFVAAGPLGETGDYDVVVYESSRELGRARLKVSASAEEAMDKERKPLEEVVPAPEGRAPTVVDEPEPSVPTTVPVDETIDGTVDEPVDGTDRAVPTTAVEQPVAEPDGAGPTTEAVEDSIDEPDRRVPTTALVDDDGLADTGSSASAGVATGALVAVLAGGALLALGRRRPA